MDQVGPFLKTSLAWPLLTTFLVRTNSDEDNYGHHQLEQPVVAFQSHTRDPWSRIDSRGIRVPVEPGAQQHANGRIRLSAMENLGPSVHRDEETNRVLHLLNNSSAKLVLNQELPLRYPHAVATNNNPFHTVHNQFPYDPVNDPGNDSTGLPKNSSTSDSIRKPDNESAIKNDVDGWAGNLGSNSSILPTNNAATDLDGGSATSHIISKPSKSGVSNGIQSARITTTTATQGTQPSLIARRVELSSTEGPMGSILGKPGCSESSSISVSAQSSFVRSPITGKERARMMMDDFGDCMREKYRKKWDDLRCMAREDRGLIVEYEEGDSDLDFSEWEEEKEKRNRARRSSVLDSVQPGFIRSPSAGKQIKRMATDDFPGCPRGKYRRAWEELRDMGPDQRKEKCPLYEDGDSELLFTSRDWEEAKEQSNSRNKKRKLSRH
jgi:hypothetical protein